MNWLRSLSLGCLVIFGAILLGCNAEPAPHTPAPSSKHTKTSAEQPIGPPLIEVTGDAADRLTQITKSQGIDGTWYVRIQTNWPKGICSPQHKLDIETNPTASDYTFESGSVKVVVLKRQVDLLRGARLRYGQKDGQVGFLVDNPNFEGELLKKWGPVVEADPLSTAR